MRKKTDPVIRFQRHVQRDTDGPILNGVRCLLWTARRREGYGLFDVERGLTVQAHRYAYELVHGEIPECLEIDHLCRNPPCVEVYHLEVVTPRVNVLRGFSPAARHARTTHCPLGHEYTPENTYFRKKRNERECRKCRALHESNRR